MMDDILAAIYEFLKSGDVSSLIWRYYINEFGSGWSMSRAHAHRAAELEFVLEGSGFLKFDSGLVKVSKNNCIIIFPNQLHDFYVPESGSCKMINIHFDLSGTVFENALPGLMDDMPFRSSSNMVFSKNEYLKLFGHNEIRDIMERIVFEMDSKKSRYDAMVKLCFCELLIAVSRIVSDNRIQEFSISQYVEECTRFIGESLAQELSPQIIASALHVSPDYLLHLFKKYTGDSLMKYVAFMRLEKARELLQHSERNIMDIAESVGIPNSQHFSTLFKKHTSMTPRQYRNISRSVNNGNANIFK